MNYDSLLLSGGGLKCYSFLGIIRYLFDNNIPRYDKRISEHYGDLHFNVWQPLEGFRYEKNIIPKDN